MDSYIRQWHRCECGEVFGAIIPLGLFGMKGSLCLDALADMELDYRMHRAICLFRRMMDGKSGGATGVKANSD